MQTFLKALFYRKTKSDPPQEKKWKNPYDLEPTERVRKADRRKYTRIKVEETRGSDVQEKVRILLADLRIPVTVGRGIRFKPERKKIILSYVARHRKRDKKGRFQ